MRPGGQPNMQQLMKQAQQMQAKMAAAQAELAATEVTGTAGGGLVTVISSGAGELLSIAIDPSVVDPSDVETLQDLIVAAVRDAAHTTQQLTQSKLGPLTGGLGIPGL